MESFTQQGFHCQHSLPVENWAGEVADQIGDRRTVNQLAAVRGRCS